MDTVATSNANGQIAPKALSRKALCEACAFAVGFGSLIAWIQLYDTCLLTSNVTLFNYSLYGGMTQLTALAALAAAGAHMSWAFPTRAVGAFGVVGAGGIVLGVSSPTVVCGIAGSIAVGVAMAVLSVAWGILLAKRPPRSILLAVAGSLLAATALCFACFAAGSTAACICGVVLPLVAGMLFARTKSSAEVREEDTRKKPSEHSTPWPFLAILGICCLTVSFFVGVTLNPYIFQSVSISRYAYLLSLSVFAVMLVWAIVSSRPKVQTAFVATLILLLAGLFLFSSGLLGSIILPLGFILATKSCCVALCWMTFATLTSASRLSPVIVLGCGLLTCNGTLGQSVGILVSNHMTPGFPDIALAASVCIAAFALIYLFLTARFPNMNQILLSDAPTMSSTSPKATSESFSACGQAQLLADRGNNETQDDLTSIDEDEPLAPSPQELAAKVRQLQTEEFELLGLTKQETRVARLILENKTYRQIAETCGISERTVKFHAKNAFGKAGVETRREFEIKMAGLE